MPEAQGDYIPTGPEPTQEQIEQLQRGVPTHFEPTREQLVVEQTAPAILEVPRALEVPSSSNSLLARGTVQIKETLRSIEAVYNNIKRPLPQAWLDKLEATPSSGERDLAFEFKEQIASELDWLRSSAEDLLARSVPRTVREEEREEEDGEALEHTTHYYPWRRGNFLSLLSYKLERIKDIASTYQPKDWSTTLLKAQVVTALDLVNTRLDGVAEDLGSIEVADNNISLTKTALKNLLRWYDILYEAQQKPKGLPTKELPTKETLQAELLKHLQKQLVSINKLGPKLGWGKVRVCKNLDLKFLPGYPGKEIVQLNFSNCVSVETLPIKLKGINFGRFLLVIQLSNLLAESGLSHTLSATPLEPLIVFPNPHPHILNYTGSVCLGDAEITIKNNRTHVDILSIFLTLNSVLNTYNPDSPFKKVSDYKSKMCLCSTCKKPVMNEAVRCYKCNNVIHPECATVCKGCKKIVCKACSQVCVCGGTYCKSCMKKHRLRDGCFLCSTAFWECATCPQRLLCAAVGEPTAPTAPELPAPELPAPELPAPELPAPELPAELLT